MSEAPQALSDVLRHHGIDLPAEQVALLDRYRRLLWDWNEKINLTRHTDLEKFVTRDVVDSLALAGLLEADERVLDLGTGGGVPGIILAVVRPDLRVTLAESVGKKAAVVEQIVRELGLQVPVHAGRAEVLLEKQKFDSVVARAVAPLSKILTWLAPRWRNVRQLLLIKGKSWAEERGEARHRGLLKDIEVRRLHAYFTPGTEAESVVLRVSPKK